ncbi:sister chromatid cohesion protein [Niveomyces insectorum RCEF 264]|uniref:Sister chromatid cohesion protein n=1 Tax=Niveomyces insectorum RCEF 264 TaxID=1081102 RepID=A0A167PIF6_9HYPO|nr:sister chromatid cohesion protein [Niveomyces insectorum RCEF 264]
MAEPNGLLSQHQQQHPQQQQPQPNGYLNGVGDDGGGGGIDPSVLLLDPNPPSSRFSASDRLSISFASVSPSPVISHTTPQQQQQQQQPNQNTSQPALPQPSTASGPQKFMRPFAFSEALPYSPFSSISPLETRIIPIPTLAAKAASAQLAQLVSQQEFDVLNASIADDTASSSPDHGLDDVHQLLASSRIPQFNFKALSQTSTSSSDATPVSPATPSSSAAAALRPVSKMVFDRANVPFRYPSPESPNEPSPNGSTPRLPSTAKVTPTRRPGSSASKAKESIIVASNGVTSLNAQSYARNLTSIEINIPSLPASLSGQTIPVQPDSPTTTPPKTNSLPAPTSSNISTTTTTTNTTTTAKANAASTLETITAPVVKQETPSRLPLTDEDSATKPKLTIELNLAPGFNPQEYQVVADLPDDTMQDVFGGLDQRQRAEATFQELLRLFQDIFEAESNIARQGGSAPFIYLTNDDEPTLTDVALRKAQSTITKAITLGCFADVPVDDLLRLQRLCDGALRHARNLDLKLSNEATESEVDEWIVQLRHADLGLKAARLTLKIMSGGREDRQLYSEDSIQTAVDLFKSVMDSVVVPIAELRSSGPLERRFKQLASYKKAIAPVFTATQRLFAGMTALVTAVDLSEMVVSALEFSASHLIFVENAHTERDSVLGVQAFDGLRLAAMDMLSQIFVKKPLQRRGIFDDILTSLEKLPIGKQSARQFKLANGRSIQPVSALIMRLVQASAGRVVDKTKPASGIVDDDALEDDEEGDAEPKSSAGAPVATIVSEEEAAYEHELSIAELTDVASPLNSMAYFHAKYVIKFIVQRAQTSSKSADTPYRNLLDLFVEDFTACLETPDWPAAELLLRLLMMAMFKLTENEKIPAPVKNMALEELGVIGAALARLRSVIHKSANSSEATGPDELDLLLSNLAAAALGEAPPAEEFLAWTGPFRSTLEYLEDRSSQDPHLRGAISYAAADWAARICRLYTSRAEAAATAAAEADTDELGDDKGGGRGDRVHERQNRELGRIAYRLRVMIEDGRGLAGNRSFKTVSAAQAKLSYAIVTLRSPLGGSFHDIINILAMGMGSDQATVRSKSLKSITEVLETDPSIFDNPASIVGRLIRECCADSSVQVRDSALGLVSRAITLRPNLEETMIKTIIDRFLDSGVGVRKRAIKVARDVYLRNQSKDIRSDIANGLLHRVQDPDEGVRELARQTIEEIWVTPFAETAAATAAGTATTAEKTFLSDHVALILQTVKTGTVTPILDKVFQAILSPTAKAAAANFEVCKRFVAVMFDLVDDPDTNDPSAPSGRDALQLMMIFAKADPRLFTFEQIRLLKPHVANVKDVQTPDDMAVARAVVVIYKRVLPQLSSVMRPFLEEVRSSLIPSVVNVSRALLDDVMGCLWVVCVLLKDPTGLVRIVLSALRGVQNQERLSEQDPLFDKKAKRFLRYTLIVGMAGKHCDLDSEIDSFRAQFPKYEATTVSKLMVDILCPFAMAPWPLSIRRIALDAVGLICQSWPRNFVLKNVYTAFHSAFSQRDPSLEVKIMQSLKEFLTKEEQRSETASDATKAEKAARLGGGAKAAAGDGGGTGKKRQLTVMGGTSHDDVASATTQRFLGDITRIALGSVSEEAYLAAEILGSISRQGLVHPKETGVTMITLETSTMPKMAELAYREHRSMHNKYETVLEREYVKAIHTVFQYQRDVIKDVRGATTEPFTPKLHHLMDVLKDSKSKNRSRLLEKMCAQVDFEPGKLDVSQSPPQHLEFARFIIENLAFLEYVTVGELQATVSAMERTVHTTGVSISHAIESELFEPAVDSKPPTAAPFQAFQDNAGGEASTTTVPTAASTPSGPVLRAGLDPRRLRQLAAGCMVLLCLWEARSFLCRQYGLKRDSTKAKGQARDLTRTPTKVQGITGDKFWDEMSVIMTGLDTDDRMVARCTGLVELLTVDAEFKLADDNDDDVAGGLLQDDDDLGSGGEDDGSGGGGRGRKRKASGGGGNNTSGGRKKRPRSSSQRRKRGRPRKNAGPEDDNDDDAAFAGF